MTYSRIMKCLCGLLCLGLLLCGKVYAVELNGVSLGPPIVDIKARPGESFEQAFIIQNRTDVTFRPEPYMQDFYVENNQWHKVDDPDPRWSPMTWATVISKPEKLEAMNENKVVVRFDVPQNAEQGEHVTYFTIRLIPVAEGSQTAGATGLSVISEIRSLIYVKVTDKWGNFDIVRIRAMCIFKCAAKFK